MGNDVAVEILVRNFRRLGLQIDHFNQEGYTALHLATKKNYLQCAKILSIKGKANLTLKDKVYQMSPMEWCVSGGYQKSEVEFLKPLTKFYKVAKLTTTIVKCRKRSSGQESFGSVSSIRVSPIKAVKKVKQKSIGLLKKSKPQQQHQQQQYDNDDVAECDDQAGMISDVSTEEKTVKKDLDKHKPEGGYLQHHQEHSVSGDMKSIAEGQALIKSGNTLRSSSMTDHHKSSSRTFANPTSLSKRKTGSSSFDSGKASSGYPRQHSMTPTLSKSRSTDDGRLIRRQHSNSKKRDGCVLSSSTPAGKISQQSKHSPKDERDDKTVMHINLPISPEHKNYIQEEGEEEEEDEGEEEEEGVEKEEEDSEIDDEDCDESESYLNSLSYYDGEIENAAYESCLDKCNNSCFGDSDIQTSSSTPSSAAAMPVPGSTMTSISKSNEDYNQSASSHGRITTTLYNSRPHHQRGREIIENKLYDFVTEESDNCHVTRSASPSPLSPQTEIEYIDLLQSNNNDSGNKKKHIESSSLGSSTSRESPLLGNTAYQQRDVLVNDNNYGRDSATPVTEISCISNEDTLSDGRNSQTMPFADGDKLEEETSSDSLSLEPFISKQFLKIAFPNENTNLKVNNSSIKHKCQSNHMHGNSGRDAEKGGDEEIKWSEIDKDVGNMDSVDIDSNNFVSRQDFRNEFNDLPSNMSSDFKGEIEEAELDLNTNEYSLGGRASQIKKDESNCSPSVDSDARENDTFTSPETIIEALDLLDVRDKSHDHDANHVNSDVICTSVKDVDALSEVDEGCELDIEVQKKDNCNSPEDFVTKDEDAIISKD